MLFSQKQIIIIANAPENIRENPFMKRCPQCHTVFESELGFCQNDEMVNDKFKSFPDIHHSSFQFINGKLNKIKNCFYSQN
jgi:hypothetical protein